MYKGLNKALGQVHSKWYLAPSYPQLIWSDTSSHSWSRHLLDAHHMSRVSDGQNPDSSPDGDQSLFDLLHISGFLGREGLGHQEASLQPLQNRLKFPRVCVWWKDRLRESEFVNWEKNNQALRNHTIITNNNHNGSSHLTKPTLCTA